MISYDKALSLVLEAVPTPKRSRLPLAKAPGHTLCEQIISGIDVAPFRNSAMDGFAVSSHLLEGCSPETPVSFPVVTTVYAGDSSHDTDRKDHVIGVMTGAAVPDQYDTVVPVEDTTTDGSRVTFTRPVEKGRHIRQPGEDVAAGQVLFEEGHLINLLEIGIIAGIGLADLPLFAKPSVKVLSTGDELVEPGVALPPGKIYNSNRYSIAAMVAGFCETLSTGSAVSDRPDELQKNLSSGEDIIVTTGGVSMGDKDFIVNASTSAGWQPIFHKVSIKPGKPLFVARRNRQLLFGLPGNPLSAAITCALFVIPAMKKLSGHTGFQLKTEAARLKDSAPRKSQRLLIWPGRIWQDGGQVCAAYSSGKSSAALSVLLNSDGLIFSKQQSDKSADPDAVEVIRWNQILKL